MTDPDSPAQPLPGDRVAPGPACDRGAPITIRFNGRTVAAYEGETLGAALHAHGERVLMRSIKYHRPRGLFCNTGACASCLVRVDGVPNVRACTTPVRDGMRVKTQNALPTARFDVFALVDKVFRRQFDHHEFMARSRLLRAPFHMTVRKMAGFGALPDETALPPRRPAVERRDVDVLVVGAGPAGLAAAAAAAEGAANVLLVDEGDRPGGSLLLAGAAGVQQARDLAARIEDAGGEVLLRTVALGCYLTDGEGRALPAPGVVAILTPERLIEVHARTLVVATGYHETPPLIPGNDLPGILGARAALTLLHRHGVKPGKRVLLAAPTPLARRAARDLADAGADVVGIVGEGALKTARLVAAQGATRVREVVLDVDGTMRNEPIDLLLSAGGETPRIELLQQTGVPLAWRDGAMTVDAGSDGATRVPGVFAVGDLLGLAPVEAHVAQGGRAGEAAARHAREAHA